MPTMQEIERIALVGPQNTRDLGGFKMADGRRIAPNRLLRSGALSSARAEDIQRLTQGHRLSLVIDLRTETERSEQPDPQIPGVENIWLPILREESIGITRGARSEDSAMLEVLESIAREGSAQAYMQRMYKDLVLSAYAQAQYGRFLRLLSGRREGASLWHCSAGKDRVGVGSALLLSALGASWSLIVRDYTATARFSAPETEAFIVRYATDNPPLSACIRTVLGAQPSYIESAFEAIQARFGSVEGYLEGPLGLTEEVRARLKELYLV